jgi:hypothetical protein
MHVACKILKVGKPFVLQRESHLLPNERGLIGPLDNLHLFSLHDPGDSCCNLVSLSFPSEGRSTEKLWEIVFGLKQSLASPFQPKKVLAQIWLHFLRSFWKMLKVTNMAMVDVINDETKSEAQISYGSQ